MKLHLYSDLHIEFCKDQGNALLRNFEHLSADFAVLAGDITTGRYPDSFKKVFQQLSKQYGALIVVSGNHEYYKTNEAQVKRSYEVAREGLSNVFVLDNELVTFNGQRFLGGTMWYRYTPGLEAYEHWMNDIHYIENFKPWVYEKQRVFEELLTQHLCDTDIVVSHHMPSYRSTAKQYIGNPLNPFFICEMEKLILEREPKLWLHGHTHTDCDYMIDKTRVVCNPKGYPRESIFGPEGYQPKEIEI